MVVKVIVPSGAFGKVENEPELDSLLRKIAVKYSTDKNEWAEKYGTKFENDEFMMHPFCWCEKDDCKWCNYDEKINQTIAPNFLHKETGFEVRWYKYIGRSMEVNKKPPIKELKNLTKGNP